MPCELGGRYVSKDILFQYTALKMETLSSNHWYLPTSPHGVTNPGQQNPNELPS
jgi:hypothetical protein